MPVISTRRYSTATGSSSFLPPSVGGTTSSLSTGYGSSYRSSSLSNSTYTTSSSGYTSSSGLYLPRTSSYRTGLYNSSSSLGGTSTSYRHSTYLSGGNNDTTATSRLGVSNNRYSRSSSDRDTKRITGKTQYNNNINTITSNRTTKTLQTKPPIAGSLSSSRRLSESRIANDQVSSKSDQNYNYNNKSNCNNALSNNINNCNSNQYQSKFTSTAGQEQSDNNNTTKISSSLSSSSLARQVATSGLEFYEKYSPAHYIPKCELSRSRSLSEATPSKLHNNDNNLSNSSNNVHQLLPQKEVLSNDRDNKSPSATSGTATSTTATTTASRSSPSSNKDISTTQLASKVKNLFAAAPNTATNNYFDNNLNASSVVVLNNNINNNIHNQKLFINNYNQKADANNIPNKYPLLQANNSSEADNCLSDLTKNYIPPSSGIATTTTTTITATTCSPNKSSISSTVVTSQKNSKSFSVVDIVNSTNSNNNTVKNHCKHDCTISSHLKEQSIQTCSNCNKTTATVIASSQTSSHQPQLLQQQLQQNQQQIQKLSQQPPVVNINTSIDRKSTSSITASGQIAATIININTKADEAFVNNNNKNNSSQGDNIDKSTTQVTPQSLKINLKATKELLSNKFDDSKIMSNNLFLIKNLRNNNNTNTNNTNNPVTVTYHTTSTTVTIQSPSIVTAVAAASNVTTTSAAITTTTTPTIKIIKNFNKSNLLDFRLDFYKNKRLSGGGTTVTAIAGGQQQNTTQGIQQQTTISNSSPNKTTTNKIGNSQNFGQSLISTYKDQNFLKSECEIARSQVVKKKNLEDNTKSKKPISIIEEKINNINNNKSNGNNNNSSTLNGSIEKLNKFNSKNIIKPLIHKTTNNKLTSRLAKIITNNNMNCLQNSPELLDDIKYIDSDENDRQQQQHQQHQKQQANKINTSLPSSSSQPPPINTLTAASFKNHSKIVNCTNNLISSTLPLTSKQRDLINSDSSSKATVTNKFNTLNDFKRIPSSVRNINSSYTATATTATNIVNINDNKLLSSSSSSSSSSPVSKNHATISNLPKTSVAIINDRNSTSRGSTPPSSPQLLRRNNIPNSNSNLSHPQHQQQQQQHATLESSSSLSSSSTILNDKKLSNKLCDIDESVRNASIRSALPPSPTPSRYWDREGRSSSTGVGSRNTHDSDDYTSSSKSSSDSYDKGSTEGLCGLRNIGNTCFMNSVIQCLSHTRELTKFLKTQMGSKASSKDQLILYEFAKLIREMWSPNIRSVTPLELKSAFSTKHRMYSGYNQQDAQEFLRFFLDSLHSALNTGSKGDPLKIDDSLSDNKKADLTWEWYSRVENSVIRDLFVGQLKSALRCTTCGNESVTFDPFWDLSVPLPSSSRCKLDACLELFIREEVLDGDEMPTCSKCQTRRKCTKTFTIQRFPRYLVIHLKRFSETRWSKLSNIVEFPTGERELNMSPYAANSSTNVLYSLYAISNHMGSTAGGHYVALCKHPSTKKWHEFNDNVVSDGLSESALVSSSAYLLFYERA